MLDNMLDRVTDELLIACPIYRNLPCTTPLSYTSLWFYRIILFRIAGYSYPRCGRSNRNCKPCSSRFTLPIQSAQSRTATWCIQQHAWSLWSLWFWSLWFSGSRKTSDFQEQIPCISRTFPPWEQALDQSISVRIRSEVAPLSQSSLQTLPRIPACSYMFMIFIIFTF